MKHNNLVALARVFHITIDELLTGKPPQCLEDAAHYDVGSEEKSLLVKYKRLSQKNKVRLQKIADVLDIK